MLYSVATFEFHFEEGWQQDVFCQQLADLGFEVFDGNEAYIQTSLWHKNKDAIEKFLVHQPVQMIRIVPCKDADWNAQWDAEHAENELPLGVRITPHCAFGAGHHETTSMMVDALLAQGQPFPYDNVLDMGCGTGVLSIMAAKCGAKKVVAVDIDEKSVINAQENASKNHVALDIRWTGVPPQESFDLIMANIHRNILIEQLPMYAKTLEPNGQIWLSGFLQEDIPALEQAAHQEGLIVYAHHSRGEWQMLQFSRL